MHEQSNHSDKNTFMVDTKDYLAVLQHVDEAAIKEAYIGLWPSRSAFGEHLLADSSADERLADLPLWLRPYVKLDGEALTRDLESEGLYIVAETKRGVCVFDGHLAKHPQAGLVVEQGGVHNGSIM